MLLCALLISGAAATPASQVEVETAASYEHLTNDRGDWRSESVEARLRLGSRDSVYAGTEDVRRFGEGDQRVWLGGYISRRRLVLHGEAGVSPSHNTLAKTGALAEIAVTVGAGWAVGASGRRTRYTSLSSSVGALSVEKYWSHYRATAGVYVSSVDTAGHAVGYRADITRYYGERSSIRAATALGREIDDVGPFGILRSTVAYGTLSGKHAFSRTFALAYEASAVRQGDLYTRVGLRLGCVVGF